MAGAVAEATGTAAADFVAVVTGILDPDAEAAVVPVAVVVAVAAF